MAIFNFLENFFFISLAITFGLFLLLVYHFKERISLVEKKNDTLNEVLMNVVKEIKNIQYKSAAMDAHLGQITSVHMGEKPHPIPISPEVVNISLGHSGSAAIPNEQPDQIYFDIQEQPPAFAKIVVSDDDDDDAVSVEHLSRQHDDSDESDDSDDSEAESVSESESEDSEAEAESEPDDDASLSDSDSDSDSDDSVDTEPEIDVESVDVSDIEQSPIKIENIVSGEEPSSAPISQEIKSLLDNLLENVTVDEDGVSPLSEYKEDVAIVDDIPKENIPEITSFEPEPVDVEPTPVLSEQAPAAAEEKHASASSTASDQKKEVYRKMNINQLRTIAISAGLAADTSKMKKIELIKLLESLDDDEDDV